MLGRYRFDSLRNSLLNNWRPSRGATGLILRDNVRNRNGTLTGGPTWVSTRGGGTSLSFDGIDDYVPISGVTFGLDFSISMWLLWRGSGTQVALGNSTSGPFIGTNGASYQINANGSSIVTGTATATWQHIAFTRLPSLVSTLYINGVGASNTITGSIGLSSFSLGAYSTGFWWNGLIDDVSFFNRALTAGEVRTLYHVGRGALDQRINNPIFRGFTPESLSGSNKNNLLIGCGF